MTYNLRPFISKLKSMTYHLRPTTSRARSRLPLFISLGFLILIGPSIYLYSKFASPAKADWFNDSWSFRKAISIPTHSSLETNVYVTVPTFDATDTPKFQSDCGDLRFTKQNGELLQYYVVDCDATANIHVFFDSLPAGATNYYMYYGNAAAANGFASADFSTAATGLGTQTLAAEERSLAPIIHMKFDEGFGTTAQDSTSHNFDGTTVGTTWETEDKCVSGKCLYFNGTDNRVDTSTKLTDITSEITVSAWVYPVNPPNGLGRIIASTYTWNADAAQQRGWILGNYFGSTDQLWMRVYDSSGTSSIASLNNFFANYKNKWVHVVGTYKAGEYVRLYIDGKLAVENTTSIVSAIAPSINNLRLGTRADNTTQAMWDGKIDDFKIYSYAQDAAQIRSEFRSRGASSGTSVSLSQNSQNDDALSNGLVGYWKMEETTTPSIDSSGNGNSGTWIANTVAGAGKFGSGSIYDGADDYISVPYNSSLKLGNNGTVSLWYKPSALNSGTHNLISYGGANYQNGYLINQNANTLIIYWGLVGGASNMSINNFFSTTNTWYHITLTNNDGMLTVYRNGIVVGTGSSGGSITNNYSTFIGGIDTYNWTASGVIDDARVYNRALSGGEVTKLYSWAPGPVAYYNFDEGTGNSANDTSGNNYNGTIANTTNWTAGKNGKALNFNGTNSYVSGTLDTTKISNTVSVGAWVNRSGTGADLGNPMFVDLGSNGTTGVRLYHDWVSGVLHYKWIVKDSGVWATCFISVADTETTDRNKWIYLEGTYDGSKVILYKNGSEIGRDTCTGGNIEYSTSTFYLGSAVASLFYTGSLDEIRIYNYARTPSQIIEDMNGGHTVIGAKTPLAYYKFDEGHGTVANNSGRGGTGLNGTFGTSAPTWSNSGKFGKALNFNNNYLSISSLTNIGPVFSISGWINPTSIPNTYHAIFGASQGINSIICSLQNTGEIIFRTSSISTQTELTSSGANIQTNRWQHIACIYDGTTRFIYINGILKGQDTTTNWTNTISANGSIGRRFGTDLPFYGSIDEVKIYNTALTAEEVKQDYNRNSLISFGGGSDTSALSGGSVASSSASAAYCVPGSSDPCSAPVAEWRFDEGQGTTTDDISGNGNTGTITSATWSRGKLGKSLLFSGNGYVNIPYAFGAPNTSTVSLWFKTGASTRGVLFDQANQPPTTTPSSFVPTIVMQTDGKIRAEFYNGVITGITSTSALNDNRWHFLSFTGNSTTQELFIDGISQGTRAGATNNSWWTNTIIGAGYDTVSRGAASNAFIYFNGEIDNVKIFNYVRTPSQIAWDYNGGAPVAHYKLNECQGTIANDASGNGNHGTITIGATGTNTAVGTCTSSGAWADGATGKYSASLDFDGTDDNVSVALNKSGAYPEVTISTWVKWGVKNTKQVLINEQNGDTIWLTLDVADEKFDVYLGDTTNKGYHSSNASIPRNTWTHISFTYSDTSDELKLYVNGKLDKTVTTSGIPNLTSSLKFGSRHLSDAEFFDGSLDDIRIYNYALTPTQIKNLFNESSAIRFGL